MADPSLGMAADMVAALQAATASPDWSPQKLNAFYDEWIRVVQLIHTNPLLTQHPNFPAFRNYMAYYLGQATSDKKIKRSLSSALNSKAQWSAPLFPPNPPPSDWPTPATPPSSKAPSSGSSRKAQGTVSAPLARVNAHISSSKPSTSRPKASDTRERIATQPAPISLGEAKDVGRRHQVAGLSSARPAEVPSKRKSSGDTGFLGVQPPPLKKIKVEPTSSSRGAGPSSSTKTSSSKGKGRAAQPPPSLYAAHQLRPHIPKTVRTTIDVETYDPEQSDNSDSSSDSSSITGDFVGDAGGDAEDAGGDDEGEVDEAQSRRQLMAAKQAAAFQAHQLAMAEVLQHLVPPSQLLSSRSDVKLLKRVTTPPPRVGPSFSITTSLLTSRSQPPPPCGRCIARGALPECVEDPKDPHGKCLACKTSSQSCSWAPSIRPPRVTLPQVREMEFLTSQAPSVNNANRAFQTLVVEHAMYDEMRKLCEFQALKVDAAQSFLANILNSTRDCGSDELIKSIASSSWYAAAENRGTSQGTVAFPVVNPANFITPASNPLPSSSSPAAPQIAVLPSSGSSSQVEDDRSVEQELGGEVRDGGVPIDEEEEGEAALDAQDAPPVA
ncbi:hypothetical protein DFP72DRAFT_849681 [Ephemerocybe angulata]|uniref:Uncharacterized protein n=1 Tax=Ephemerocybe angulata TaxID=980116 RepID=A0A8H6HU98_9AGAR|nr:hypothetical protein DFP72DRAFT_849681 [Tulosesus angulatus]